MAQLHTPAEAAEILSIRESWLRDKAAARETRVATRLRAVQHACHTAIEGGAAFGPPEPIRTSRSPEHPADREIELD